MSSEGQRLGAALMEAATRMRLYTLEEAERELARRKCSREGHLYDVQTTMNLNEPVLVVCATCGKTWNVES